MNTSITAFTFYQKDLSKVLWSIFEIKKDRPKSKISQQIPDIFMRLLSCCFPQEKDLLGQGKSVIYASMWKTGYCDTLKKALDRIL